MAKEIRVLQEYSINLDAIAYHASVSNGFEIYDCPFFGRENEEGAVKELIKTIVDLGWNRSAIDQLPIEPWQEGHYIDIGEIDLGE